MYMDLTQEEIELLKSVLIDYEWIIEDRLKREQPTQEIREKTEAELQEVNRILRKLYQ